MPLLPPAKVPFGDACVVANHKSRYDPDINPRFESNDHAHKPQDLFTLFRLFSLVCSNFHSSSFLKTSPFSQLFSRALLKRDFSRIPTDPRKTTMHNRDATPSGS